jgi:hypothetical protein
MQKCNVKLAPRKYFKGVWIAKIREQGRKRQQAWRRGKKKPDS